MAACRGVRRRQKRRTPTAERAGPLVTWRNRRRVQRGDGEPEPGIERAAVSAP